MNAKSNPQKKSNKEISLTMIPKIMSGATSTKSNDNTLLNSVNVFVKSEEKTFISSNKTAQSNTYKNREISDSTIQSTVDQIEDHESHQSNADTHKISNSDNISLQVKEIIACPESHPISQKEMINEQKPIKSIIIPSAQAKKRGRPRKYVCIQIPQKCDDDSSQLHVSNSEASMYHTKNSTNTFVDASDSKSSDQNIKVNTSDNINAPKRRGRPPSKNKSIIKNEVKDRNKKKVTINTHDIEHIPELSNTATVTKENSRLNVVEEEEIQLIKCMRCEKKIAKGQQEVHNLMKHNNMGWYEGEESMDFQNDIKLLKRVLANAIKKKKGQLGCEQCGAIKRSVNGFISHIQFCGKSDDEKRALMVTCSVCNAVMMPSSMEIHERHHRDLKYNKRKSLLMEFPENEKVRRKAAEKAVSKILQFTELVKDECLGQSKKVDLNSSVLKNVKMPELRKKVPSVWKAIWKKELELEGVSKCRQIGCNFSCSSYEDMCKHCSECNFTPQENFACKICKFFAESKEKIIEHIKAKHETDDNADNSPDFKKEDNTSDESEDEPLAERFKQQSHAINTEKEKSCSIMMFLDDSYSLKAPWSKFYLPTLNWTMEYEMENYEFQLFHDYLPNPFVLLNNEDAMRYLPPLKASMPTKTVNLNSSGNVENEESEWKYWKTFEGGISQDLPTFFTGGPVWALAWLSIPAYAYLKTPDQYIALSTHPDMESEYAIGKAYSGHNMIQIWNMGKLNNESKSIISAPILSYAIVHNSSTIWSLEWCPSGCYQDDTLNNFEKGTVSFRRMGLLAAAGSDGSVYVYSLPFPEELKFNKSETNNLPIYKTDPVLILVVNSIIYNNDKQHWQCTKISWTKERGHNTIAAGFSNGYIALWDLTEESPLLKQKQNDSLIINAFSHFFAHDSAVSMLALIPYNNQRFLASASVDRFYKIWDLENTNSPQESVKKGMITDGVWMLHWPSAVIGFDDALGFRHTNSYLVPLREHGFKLCPLLATNSPTYTVAVSDHANGIAHGSLAGDIISIFPHQLLYAKDVDKILPRKRQLNSFIKVVDLKELPKDSLKKQKGNGKEKKSKDYNYMPETYNECKERFGIIFHNNFVSVKDSLSKDIHQKVLYSEKLTYVPIEQYPFTSVNKIAWNPNMWSHLWLAAGYQNGLVRLLNFTFMSPKCDMNKLIKEHAEAFLKRIKNQSQNHD
ncbi:general transcription factor 3C polypeptide 2-like isoform X1 [Vespa velutina]|uniref:general transcription factor 3C polypeptide 2-like isoform X1 n=2 Tax=Vespa velutina TaxID=202808 RepID=UPI001FB29703|nr:general transcription factor 3C polypeptide 2-like isoform X1 [Vespa velutina]